MEKNKKKTLTISSSLKKKIDTGNISRDGKKSFEVEKKRTFKPNRSFIKTNQSLSQKVNTDFKIMGIEDFFLKKPLVALFVFLSFFLPILTHVFIL